MIQLFIRHVLGVNISIDGAAPSGTRPSPRGFYGKTDAYYGTVEQQGRLTLHLHILIWIKSALSPQEIRDRLMDPNSDFQTQLVQYLEGVHMGEFISSTRDDVKQMLDHTMVDDSLPTAVESMPVPPPVCKKGENCSNEDECKKCGSWWTQFTDTVNELILRCNTHRCSGNRTDTSDNRHQGNGKNKYQPAVGCCSNKWGKCKARFPRDVHACTFVEPSSGALLMKKGEAMMNCFTDVVTYLFRCNTDVTSLLSGTAIKAVVAYISDYISKPSLKTYVVFDTIRSVFDKNTTLLCSSADSGEKARKIMTQIVNSLTSKMEIGAPMASLYLLGNPDHYTSHVFAPIYWKSYVAEARQFWEVKSDKLLSEDNIILHRSKGSVIGTSPVFDYIFRPMAFENMTLYDWVRLSEKQKIPKIKDGKKKRNSTSTKLPKHSEFHPFTSDHPLHKSHHVRVLLRGEGKVPNFIGGALPRHDKGDSDYYSSTMLALFVPWRSGKDLKPAHMSWHEQFEQQVFTPRQSEIMKFFNVRYECLDARDDYSSQLKSQDGLFHSDWANEKYPPLDDDDDWVENDANFPQVDADCIIDNSVVGKLTSKWNYDKTIVQQMLQYCGWLSPSVSPEPNPIDGPLEIDDSISSSEWKARVKTQKEQVQEVRLAHMQQNPSRRSTVQHNEKNNTHPNEVCVVDGEYLLKDFKPKLRKDRRLIDRVVDKFTLNEEQERAFRIVANHS
ncbi:hypothetical protein BJ138DRAFT_1016688, partial [Hygrophoropsis aurantiaca]